MYGFSEHFFLVLHAIVVFNPLLCNNIAPMSYFENVHKGKICPKLLTAKLELNNILHNCSPLLEDV